MFKNTVNQFARKIVAIILSAGVMALLFGITTNPVHAGNTIPVTSLLDTGAGTLRAAISSAGSGDTITFSVSGTITLLTGQLTINSNLTIDGTGQAITINGGSGVSQDRVFCVPGNTALTINALTITNGLPSSLCNSDNTSGGGLYSQGVLTLTNSTFSSNSAASGGDGGGLFSEGAVTVTNSTFSGNLVPDGGGRGGGFYSSGAVMVTNSTFSDNSAVSGGGGIDSLSLVTVTNSTFSGNSAVVGGGIFASAVTVTNSTFFGNSAGGNGGGLYSSGGKVTVTNSTFSGNVAGFYGGGGISSHGAVTVTNTIITKSFGGACAAEGVPTTTTHSLIDDNTCGTTISKVTGLSATLVNNGGPTQTIALSAGSNAINAVPAGKCTVNIDQRDYVRPAGLLCDIGAYEYGAVPPLTPTPTTVSSGPSH